MVKIQLEELHVKMNMASAEDIELYIMKHSADFFPAFHTKNNVAEYAEKLRKLGNTYELWYNGELDALMAVYFNEQLKQIYVPYICTAGAHYAPHVGQYLFRMIMHFSTPFEYVRLEVRKNNLRAVTFYLKQGFTIKHDAGEKVLLEYKLCKNQ